MAIYKTLDSLISSLPISTSADTGADVNANFKTLLIQLRDNLIDTNTTKSNVVAVKDYWQANTITLDDGQKTTLESIFAKLSDKSVIAAE